MKMKRSWITPFLLLTCVVTLFWHCKKDDTEPTVNPINLPNDISLEQAITSLNNGLRLVAKISKIPDSVMEYGFVIGKDSLFKNSLKMVKLVRVNNPMNIGEFSISVNAGLTKDSLYYVRPYLLKTNYTQKLYNLKSFVWKGDKAVVIDSVYPKKAIIGDTLTLKGKYFAEPNFSIKFGNKYSTIISKNDSTIKFLVPTDINEQSPLITLNTSSKIDTVTQNFSLHTPIITNFTTTGTFRDTITINGNYFSRYLNGNKLKFGNKAAKITSYSKTEIKAIVPDDIEASHTNIGVQAQLQEVKSITTFVIRKPELTVVPSSGYTNDEITIQGKYFHPSININKLTFENNAATISSGNTTNLKLRIPHAPYPKRTATVTLKLLDYEISYSIKLNILDTWLMVSNTIPFRAYFSANAFIINQTPYVIANSKNYLDNKWYLWKFERDSYTWQKIDIPFDLKVVNATTVGNKLYVYTGGSVDNFWEYDPSTNKWTKKANYIGLERLRGTMFGIGTSLYIGMGRNPLPFLQSQPDNIFYKYDTVNEVWIKETDYPTTFGNGERISPSSFVVEGTAYIACGSVNTGMNQFYSYTPATKTWQKLANFPDARGYTTAFQHQKYGFIAGGTPIGGSPRNDCYSYDVAKNMWTQLPDPIGLWGTEGSYSFVHNNRVFTGSGNSSSDNYLLYMAEVNQLVSGNQSEINSRRR
jgi:N-acetylneuraminic acid mutarotase